MEAMESAAQEKMREEAILARLDPAIAGGIRKVLPLYQGRQPTLLEEIRIRIHRPILLTLSGRSHPLELICDQDMMQRTVQMLCSHSLYSHAETLREGYICVAGGIRVGVCGRAVVEHGRITVLRDISSLCIRLPHRIQEAGQEIYDALAARCFQDSVLVFSPPGMGKTTVLRELAARLSDPPHPLRVALIDTRYELNVGLEHCLMLDVLSGYPRNQGMEIALRTLSPDYIICDEVSSAEDRQAIWQCLGSGVRVCASVHAGSLEELQNHPLLQNIPTLFPWYYGIDQDHTGTLYPARGNRP